MWAGAAELILQRVPGARLLMPDLRGLGASPVVSAADPPSIATYADDLAHLLAEMDVKAPVVVCGLSMGGIIAFEFFRRHRALVAALVLCDTRPEPESDSGRSLREQRAQSTERDGAAGVRAIAEAMIGSVCAPGVSAPTRDRVLALMVDHPPDGVAAASRALAGRADSWPTLSTIDVPTLLIVGESDQITSVELHRQMAAKIRGSRLTVITGAGHIPPMEAPAAFASAVSDFLSSLQTGLTWRGT